MGCSHLQMPAALELWSLIKFAIAHSQRTQVDHKDVTHDSLLEFNKLWLRECAHDSLLVFSTGRSPQLFEKLAVRFHLYA